MRLGRLDTDPGVLARAPQIRYGASQLDVPDHNVPNLRFDPKLWQNNELPICTMVAQLNCMRTNSNALGYDLSISDDAAMSQYARVVKCAPTVEAIKATDGTYMLAAGAQTALHSFDLGPQKISGGLVTTAVERRHIAKTILTFGHLYTGIYLYANDMGETDWNAPKEERGDFVGGHAITAVGWTGLGDTDDVIVDRWGQWYRTPWSWFLDRTTEAHAWTFPQIRVPSAANTSGPDIWQIMAEAHQFATQEFA